MKKKRRTKWQSSIQSLDLSKLVSNEYFYLPFANFFSFWAIHQRPHKAIEQKHWKEIRGPPTNVNYFRSKGESFEQTNSKIEWKWFFAFVFPAHISFSVQSLVSHSISVGRSFICSINGNCIQTFPPFAFILNV